MGNERLKTIGLITYDKELYYDGEDFAVRHDVDHIHTLSKVGNWNDVDWFFFFEMEPTWKCDILREINQSGWLDRAVLYMSEEETVVAWHSKDYIDFVKKYFAVIFTQDKRLADDKTVFYLPLIRTMKENEGGFSKKSYNERKLICCISSDKTSAARNELYSERRRVIEYFEENHSGDFDLYGHGWEKRGYKNYRGTCESKAEVYHNYRFALCLENAIGITGDITEKIYDCICAGIIPIYLGAPDVSEVIPNSCFIDYGRFDSISDMYAFISQMSESEFEAYMSAQREFLESDAYQSLFAEGWEKRILTDLDRYEQSGMTHARKVSGLSISLFRLFVGNFGGKYVACRNRLRMKRE